MKVALSPVFRFMAPAFAILLAGCSTAPHSPTAEIAAGTNGSVYGGQQPVAGATLQMYAVGTAGDGTAAVPLFSPAVTTTAYGNFNFPNNWQANCPSTTSPVYLVATGGNPGLGTGTVNPQLALVAALGACNTITPTSYVSINELTTVAAAYALSPFATGPAAVASGSSDAAALANAFTFANQLVNSATGQTPGIGLPTGYAAPVAQINTIADILSTCINSPGGTYNDKSACGTFFYYTTPSASTPPTDAFTTLVNLANNSAENTAALYNLAPPTAPYQPSDSTQPADFSLHLLTQTTLTLTSSLGYNPPDGDSQTDTATLTNTGSAAASIYSIGLSGSGASEFTQFNNCPATLAPSASCSIQITFTPTSTSTAYASLAVSSNASTSPTLNTSLIGSTYVSVLLVLPGSPVTFASTPVFTSAASQTITLSNYGPSPAILNGISFVGTNPGDFTQTNNCPSPLQAGNGCSITITFTPSAAGSRTATLSVASNSASSPTTLTVSGTGQ